MSVLQLIKDKIKQLKEGDGLTAKASRQVIISFALQSINILIGFIYVPLLLNYLTQEKYGIWLTLTSIIGWFSFFDIGLGNGMRNKLTESNAKGEHLLGRKYVSTTYALLLVIFSAILLIFHLLNPFLNWNLVLNTYSINGKELYALTSIVFSFFIIRFVVQLIGVIYMADLKPSVGNAINAFSSIFSLTAILLLKKFGAPGNLIALGTFITMMPVLLFILLSIFAFSTRYKHLRPGIKFIDFKLNSGLISLGAKFFFLQITAIILYSTSSFFISQFYGPKEVVVYNLIFKYFQMPIMVYSIILSPLWSSVTNAYVRNDFDWLKKTIKRLNIISFLFITGIIVMVICSNYILSLWIGNTVHVPLRLTILMAMYAIMNIFLAPYSYFVNGTGKLKLTMLFSVVGILLYFLCIYIFGHHFTDSTGVIASILVPYVIFTFLQPFQTYKILSKKAKGIFLR